MEPLSPSARPPPLLQQAPVHGADRSMEGLSMVMEDPSSTSIWDWGDLLDFTMDDHLSISFDSEQTPITPPPPVENLPVLDRVRKRDPRLTCSNFLAGRVPCACPEIDELLEAEEGLPGKKRARMSRGGAGAYKCQVPGCETDISELKGYHKRHRVCLRCANASSVLLEGENKRYCQQCGKFHVLTNFDEGKRSCRRKLERHNKLRRKPSDSRVAALKEPQGVLQTEDVNCDGEAGKDGLCISDQIIENETLFESEDGHFSTFHSAPNSQNVNSDSGVSFGASGDTQTDGGNDDSKYTLSPSCCDDKNAYFSSMCPTGRISFKLYDWNPAEFPRRLRHQIFQWLASMPVELEGYIRPGCTILTVFIAMPRFMWGKLYEDPVSYIHDFVVTPGRMLSKKGTILIYLNDMIFRVMKDGNSVMKVNVDVHSPKLHYVHPTCFEAGKPMEFIVCGTNLLRPKLRFLVSFAGKYLAYDHCVALPHGHTEAGTASRFEHQLYEIHIPHVEPNLFGPAFIEVENELGLSNFIPVLIGDKDICSEMKIIQQRFDASLFSKGSQVAASGSVSDSCEVSALRQMAFSELVLDVGWLLKEPALENFQQRMSTSQIQRFNSLLTVLICNESTAVLEKILQNLKIVMDSMDLKGVINGTIDADMKLLQNQLGCAKHILQKKILKDDGSILHSKSIVLRSDSIFESCSQSSMLPVVPVSNHDVVIKSKDKFGAVAGSTYIDKNQSLALLSGEVVMNMNPVTEWPRKSCGHIFSGTILRAYPTVFVIATATICFGLCVVLFHPQKVGQLAVTVRRCFFEEY